MRVRRQFDCYTWNDQPNVNAIWGLVPSPGQESRPHTFYFGQFGSDWQQCKQACEAESNCYVRHTTSPSYTFPSFFTSLHACRPTPCTWPASGGRGLVIATVAATSTTSESQKATYIQASKKSASVRKHVEYSKIKIKCVNNTNTYVYVRTCFNLQ